VRVAHLTRWLGRVASAVLLQEAFAKNKKEELRLSAFSRVYLVFRLALRSAVFTHDGSLALHRREGGEGGEGFTRITGIREGRHLRHFRLKIVSGTWHGGNSFALTWLPQIIRESFKLRKSLPFPAPYNCIMASQQLPFLDLVEPF
jgi:hypothetical protein